MSFLLHLCLRLRNHFSVLSGSINDTVENRQQESAGITFKVEASPKQLTSVIKRIESRTIPSVS